MACRNCGLAQPLALAYVCPACFGPLEVTYDCAQSSARPSPTTAIAARTPGHLALPRAAAGRRGAGAVACRSARRRCSPPTGSARSLGVDRLWLKDDTRNPSLSFKDRAVAVAAARAVEFGVPALACASTGNLAGATAAAAAAVGLPAYVFIPADLEPAKVDHALAYGATVVPIDGTYDDVNRLCLEIADETGWGFVNINLRPVLRRGLQDARLRDRRVARLALARRGRRAGRVGRDVHARRAAASRSSPSSGSSSAGRSASSAARRPAARRSPTAWAAGTDVIEPVREPDTIVRSLAIGNPADGRYAVELARASGGSIEAIAGRGDRGGDPRRRPARGHLPRDGRRRDARRRRRGAPTRRHPRRRRGRRAADRQRPQDTRRADARPADGGCRGPARPARSGAGDPARACRPSSRGWRRAS